MPQDVRFYSEQSAIAGHLYLPAGLPGGEKCPAILLCHGFAGIKELLLPAFAEAFARKGYVALTFDYRGFGASEGLPGNLVPTEQVRDIRNAITYLQSLAEVDAERIGLWGTSYGGAHIITAAAQDKRVKCLCAQLTFGSGKRVITNGMSAAEQAKLSATLHRAWQKAVVKNRVMALAPNQILTDEQSKEFYTQAVEEFPALACKIPILTILHTIEYNPEESIEKVKVPILILAAEKDGVNPPGESEALYDKANEPKAYHCIAGATHYQVYAGEPFQEAVTQQLAWFAQHL